MNLTSIVFTPIEFGAMALVLDQIKIAKTKRESDKLYSSMHSFVKSMGSISHRWRIDGPFVIRNIEVITILSSYPAVTQYEVLCEY